MKNSNVGYGIYISVGDSLGGTIGVSPDGSGTLAIYTQISLVSTEADGYSFSYGENGLSVERTRTQGISTPPLLPVSASIMFDVKTGHVTMSGGAGVRKWAEVGGYVEFESFDALMEALGKAPPPEPQRRDRDKKPEDDKPHRPEDDGDHQPSRDDDPCGGKGAGKQGLWLPQLPPIPYDPLVLDLNGDGIQLTSLKNSRAHFDFDKDGFREKTGWLSSKDGFLFADADNNGIVTGIDELFGSANEDGFVELARMDTNKDGVIDARDAEFEKLKIWKDANCDGISTADEISGIVSHDITALNGGSRPENRVMEGNELRNMGSATLGSGETMSIGTAYFARSSSVTEWVRPDDFVMDTDAMKLPFLPGYGQLADLDCAMTLDANLKADVTALLGSIAHKSVDEIKSAFEPMLYRWAKVETIPTSSRGEYVDARKMAFVEIYLGQAFQAWTNREDVDSRYGARIDKTFNEIADALFLRFASQAVPFALLGGARIEDLQKSPFMPFLVLSYDRVSDSFKGSLETLTKFVAATLVANPENALLDISNILKISQGGRLDFYYTWTLADKIAKALPSDSVIRDILSRAQGNELVMGTSGNDTLSGTSGIDVIVGGPGDDVLDGGEDRGIINSPSNGRDTFVWCHGDGNDTIIEQGGEVDDALKLLGVARDKVQFARNGGTLIVSISESAQGKNDGGSITVLQNLETRGLGIEYFEFGDGSRKTLAQVKDDFLAASQTEGDDNIRGSWMADIISGKKGNDVISALGGNDVLEGGEGDDTIDAGWGRDTYIWRHGDGHDLLQRKDANHAFISESHDVKILDLKTVSAEQISLERAQNSIVLRIAESAPGKKDGGSIKIDLSTGLRKVVSSVKFQNGDYWTDYEVQQRAIDAMRTDGLHTVFYTSRDDTITGGPGDDIIEGGYGNDTYIWRHGDGNDTISDWGGDNDSLKFEGVDVSLVSVSREGDDLRLSIADSSVGARDGATLLLKNGFQRIEKINFDDGVVWDREFTEKRFFAPKATDGDDTIVGTSYKDEIIGGPGNDMLSGGNDDDTYIWRRGHGKDTIIELEREGYDTLVLEGVLPTARQVKVVRKDDDFILKISSSVKGARDGGAVLIKDGFLPYNSGVETIRFSDGSKWDIDTVKNMWLAKASTDGDDTIIGFPRGNVITGGKGNDTLSGGDGWDTYIWRRGDGNDKIFEYPVHGSDILKLEGVSAEQLDLRRKEGAIIVRIKDSVKGTKDGGIITLVDMVSGGDGSGIEKIVFDDGRVAGRNAMLEKAWYFGGDGNETFTGTQLSERFFGGKGNDTLTGGAGDDLFRFGKSFGRDVITDFTVGARSDDKIQLAKALARNFAGVQSKAVQDGEDTVITFADDAVLRLQNVQKTALHADDFMFG